MCSRFLLPVDSVSTLDTPLNNGTDYNTSYPLINFINADFKVQYGIMKYVLSFLFILFMKGVFGDADDVISVKEGDSVTLHTGATEILRDDVIDWRFGPKADRIVRINRPANKTVISDGPDGRFRDRLKLDHQTGSLTITNMRTTDSGLFKVTFSTAKTFRVTVEPADTVGSISLMERDSVTLHTGVKIHRDDTIQWEFQNSSVAEINRDAGIFNTYDGADGRFKDRLQLDFLTGSLTISNIGKRQSGLYEVDISNSNHIIRKSFTLTFSDAVKSLTVKKGDSVTLHTDTEIQNNDLILWMFGDTVIAEIDKATQQFNISDGPDGRFRDRLELDHQTGSLTITNTRTTDSGDYELKISSSRHTINRRFTVTVTDTVKTVSVEKGDSVTLHTDTEIQSNDLIQWMFGDTVIAKIDKAAQRFSISDGPDGRFRDRLKLDHQTGSLTITNTKTTDSGLYELKISSSRRSINRRITVTVIGPGLSPGAVAGIVALLLVAAAVAAGVIYYCHTISKLGSRTCAVAVIVALLLVAAAVVAVVIYYGHTVSELESNWRSGSDLNSGSGLSSGAVAGIFFFVLLLVAAAVAAVLIYCCHKNSKLGSHSRAVAQIVVVVILVAAAVVAVLIYYGHTISELESNWRLDLNSGSVLSKDVPWVILFLLLVATVAVLAAVVIRRKISELESHRQEKRQSHKKHYTDDSADEETKFDHSSGNREQQ